MNRRAVSKEETRRLILNATRKLLAKKGGEDCTLKDIAIEAGTSPASIVVHFKSRTSLLEEALYIDIENTLSKLRDSLPENVSLRERLMHMPNGFFSFYSKKRHLYKSLLRSTIFEPQNETPYMTKQSEKYVQYLLSIIDEEKRKGIVREDIDSRIAAASLFSLYLGMLVTLFRTPELSVKMLTQIYASMVDQYLRGILITER
ncbi:MAG: TetR/AcrR family transcriptional regulator [Nitrospirota bacterium]|nr:TetR/AcrR family transcriptional regulator [Nitrospirota bacterium]